MSIGVEKRASASYEGHQIMTKDQKIIKAKIGLLELAQQLGNVSQALQNARLFAR